MTAAEYQPQSTDQSLIIISSVCYDFVQNGKCSKKTSNWKSLHDPLSAWNSIIQPKVSDAIQTTCLLINPFVLILWKWTSHCLRDRSWIYFLDKEDFRTEIIWFRGLLPDNQGRVECFVSGAWMFQNSFGCVFCQESGIVMINAECQHYCSVYRIHQV